MAGSKGSKYYDVFLDYQITLKQQAQEVIDPPLFDLLIRIHEEGSLLKAAEKCGVSYRKAWGDIRRMEKLLGFKFVEGSRGGARGGQSSLTGDGLNIINAYLELKNEMESAVSSISKKFFQKIND